MWADIYGLSTSRLNEQVKRNIERFPEYFRFQLAEIETNELAANCDRFRTLKHSNQNPFAYTEQGVAMLSAVLRSEIAIQVSIQIINAFVEMRKILLNHSGLIQRMDGLERKQIETEQKFERVFQAPEQNTIPTQGIFFDGQVFDAYALCSRIIRSANKSIVLIDNYIDESTFVHLSKKREGVTVLLLTKSISEQIQLDLQKAEVFGPTNNMVDLS